VFALNVAESSKESPSLLKEAVAGIALIPVTMPLFVQANMSRVERAEKKFTDHQSD